MQTPTSLVVTRQGESKRLMMIMMLMMIGAVGCLLWLLNTAKSGMFVDDGPDVELVDYDYGVGLQERASDIEMRHLQQLLGRETGDCCVGVVDERLIVDALVDMFDLVLEQLGLPQLQRQPPFDDAFDGAQQAADDNVASLRTQIAFR